MTTETYIQSAKRQIKDLSRHEFNMIYSLVRVGDWPDSEIGRVYMLSEEDVRKVFNNYEELFEATDKNPSLQQQLQQGPSPERIEKRRKLRSDAKFTSPAARQAAYRARLQERRHTVIEQPSPANETDSPRPGVEVLPATFCQDPVTETNPENAEMQHSACYDSSVEGCDISESTPLPVTPEARSEREELRVVEEET
jgi:hypothetical protein